MYVFRLLLEKGKFVKVTHPAQIRNKYLHYVLTPKATYNQLLAAQVPNPQNLLYSVKDFDKIHSCCTDG